MERDIHALPDALDHLEELQNRLHGKQLAVFLDFDGTLTPIVEKPDLVVLSLTMRDTVAALSAQFPVAVISGRRCADVKRHVGIDGITYAGSHGFDIAWPDGTETFHDACRDARPNLTRARDVLQQELSDLSGILIEQKICSIAVHYRLADESAEKAAHDTVAKLIASDPGLKSIDGKKVLEIMPAVQWNKGTAVLWLLEMMKLEQSNTIPFFIGDDVTDEFAFQAINEFGIGFLVCDDERTDNGHLTHAQYILRNTEEVGALLRFFSDNV